MSTYYRSQLTSSNGHVTGIDSPMPEYKPVARPDRHNSIIDDLVSKGIEAIEEYEKHTNNMKITCLIDADARIIRHSIAKQARKELQNLS